MTPEQIRIVREIVDQVRGSEAFAVGFYRRLFAAVPETRGMFSDLDAQRVKLTGELDALVDLISDLPALQARAADLGERHRGYGVRASHYRQARAAMVESLAEVLGPDFGPAEVEAWDRATSLITELMQAT